MAYNFFKKGFNNSFLSNQKWDPDQHYFPGSGYVNIILEVVPIRLQGIADSYCLTQKDSILPCNILCV